MRTLSILKDKEEYTLAFSKLTILHGYSNIWYDIVNCIKEFFYGKNSDTKLCLDTVAINKKDWECIFLSFSDSISFSDKLTLKSPIYLKLLQLVNENTDILEYTILHNSWFDFCDTLTDIFKNQMNSLDLNLNLQYNDIPVSAIVSNLKIVSDQDLLFFDKRLILLKWFLSSSQTKCRIIIIEYPEIYADSKQLNNLLDIINHNNKNETYFILISGYEFKCEYCKNIILNDSILNEYYINLFCDKVKESLPFMFYEYEFTFSAKFLVDFLNSSSFYYEFNKNSIKCQYIIIYLCKAIGINIELEYIKNNDVKDFYNNI